MLSCGLRESWGVFGVMVALAFSPAYLSESIGLANRGQGSRNQPRASPRLDLLCTLAASSETQPPALHRYKAGQPHLETCPGMPEP